MVQTEGRLENSGGNGGSLEGYRPPCQIPIGLRDTLKIILEEELYVPGLELLHGLISQGASSTSSHSHAIPSSGSTTPTITLTSSTTTSAIPVYIPPTAHLRLCTTILAHPSFTTHISFKKDRDASLVPPLAERLLRQLLCLAGPVGMDLTIAWGRFGSGNRGTGASTSSMDLGGRAERAERRGGTPGPSAEMQDNVMFEDNKLDLSLARRESLFERAEDFWAIVGWAFTCACARNVDKKALGEGLSLDEIKERRKWMRKRWEGGWKRLLGVIIDGLVKDWEDRGRMWNGGDGEGGASDDGVGGIKGKRGGKDGEEGSHPQREALIVKYLTSKSSGNAFFRRVIRVIFADGRSRVGLGLEWKEIWRDEAVSPKTIRIRKRGIKNAQKGIALSKEEEKKEKMRSFLEDSESEGEDEEDRSTGADSGGTSAKGYGRRGGGDMDAMDVDYGDEEMKPADGSEEWGGMEALLLRHRILVLISEVSRKGYFVSPYDLSEEIKDYVVSLPLPEFTLFISPLLLPQSPPSPLSSTTESQSLTTTVLPTPTTPPSTYYHLTLLLTLLQSVITSDAPSPTSTFRDCHGIQHQGYGLDMINESLLLTCYLPWPARTSNLVDNTKMAVILEMLVRCMVRLGALQGGPQLVGSMEDGVERRRVKVGSAVDEGSSGSGGPGARGGRGGKTAKGKKAEVKKGKGKKEKEEEERRRRREWEEAERRLRGLIEVVCML